MEKAEMANPRVAKSVRTSMPQSYGEHPGANTAKPGSVGKKSTVPR